MDIAPEKPENLTIPLGDGTPTAVTLTGIFSVASYGNQTVAGTAIPLAFWNFDTNTINPKTTVSASIPADSGIFASTSAIFGNKANSSTSYTAPSGNPSTGKCFSADHWQVGDYFQFNTSSNYYDFLTLFFDVLGSSTGPLNFSISYSTDNVSYTNVGTFTVATTYATKVCDLSSVLILNNQSNIYFRLTNTSTTSIGNGTVGSTGSFHIDNLRINGTPLKVVVGTAISTEEFFGNIYLSTTSYLNGIPSASSFGNVKTNVTYVSLIGIGDQSSLGTPKLSSNTNLSGISSGSSFGNILISKAITLTGIASASSFGIQKLNSVLYLPGIPSSSTFGLQDVLETIGLSGIGSSSAFGNIQVVSDIILTGIPSQETIGIISLLTQHPVLEGIISDEEIGDISAEIKIYMSAHCFAPGQEQISIGCVKNSALVPAITLVNNYNFMRFFVKNLPKDKSGLYVKDIWE